MKFHLTLLIWFVMMAVVARGNNQQEAEQPLAIPPPEKATQIDVIGWAFPITEFYAQEFETFNAVDNLKINVQLLSSASAQEQVRLALSGGKQSPYEIVHAANSQISEWGFPGWLMPLDDLVEKYWEQYDLGDIPAAAWEAAKIDGKIVGIPAVSNSFQLIYRADLFEKYNLQPPQTFAEVLQAARVLKQEPSIDLPFVINLHAGWAWETEFLGMIRGFGGRYVDANNRPIFNGPEGVKALELMLEIANEMGDEGLAYGVDDTEIGLQTGRLAFSNTWTSRAVKMNDPEFSDYAEELNFAPSPAAVAGGPLVATAWNDFYAIPLNIDVDRELVFLILMETLDLESQLRALEFGVPTRKKALFDSKAGKYMQAAAEGLERGVGAYSNTPAIPLLRSALGEALPLITSGNYTAQQVLDRAAESYLREAQANGFING